MPRQVQLNLRARVVLLICALLVVGCGAPDAVRPESPASELTVIALPDADGRMPPDAVIGCISGPFFPASSLDQIRPYDPTEFPEVDVAFRDFLDDEEGQFWPQEGWQILSKSEQEFHIVHASAQGDSLSFMNAEWTGGTWKWAGASGQSGECDLYTALPEGMNRVEWRLSPAAAQPLSSESTNITVLVTERACASGEEMGDRLLGPEIVMTETQVMIAFAASAQSGAQTCPGNPETSVTIQLPETLGGRELIDGLAVAGDLLDYLD